MNTAAYLVGISFLLTAAVPASAQRVRIGDVPTIPNGRVQVPTVIGEPTAPYSAEGRSRKIEGTVTVEAAIDADGNVSGLRVVRGLGYGLDESAVEAVKTWRFVPAYRNGTPIP